MSPVETLLAEVPAVHELSWDESGGWADCSCGYDFANQTDLAPDMLDAAHRAHVAAEQAKALREWLTSDATFLVAREAILNRPIPPYTGFGAARADARAVLAALTDLIGAES